MIGWADPLAVGAPAARGLPAMRPQPPSDRRLVLEIVSFVALALAFVLFFRTFVVEVRWIPSASMTDQLQIHDRVAVSKLSYRLHTPNRGDVVVFDPPVEGAPPASRPLLVKWLRKLGESFALVRPESDDYIKRVIGLPGEVVAGREGAVWIDGKRLIEPYLSPGVATSDFPPTQVPLAHVWVMGDNRPNSSDSRYFGPVGYRKIVGRAVVRIWPPLSVSFL